VPVIGLVIVRVLVIAPETKVLTIWKTFAEPSPVPISSSVAVTCDESWSSSFGPFAALVE
jgi:hypothetical protein